MPTSSLLLLLTAAAPQSQEVPPAAPDGPADAARAEGIDWLWGPGFTPDIDVYGNVFARKERKPVFDENGDEVGDVARLRQLDVIVATPLAENVDLLVAASVQSTLANDEFGLEFDQAWVRFRELPLVGELPEGLSASVGQFRVNTGRLNRERVFDLPQPTRPRALTNFFGEGGYSESGARGTWKVPVTEHGSVRLTAEYMDSGSPPLTDREGGFAGGNNFRLSWETDEVAEHGVEVGLSQLRTRRADQDSRRATVTALDALYHWRPEPSGPPLLWLGGEWLDGDVDRLAGGAASPSGAYVWSQARIHERWAIGARVDIAEELEDETLQTRTAGLYVTYLQSETVRFSVLAERSTSDVALLDDVTRVFFELNFAVGTGPDRPFWMR